LLGLYLFSLLGSVYTLKCLQCLRGSGQCSTTESAECDTNFVCATLRTSIDVSGFSVATTTVSRACLEQSFCSQLNATEKGISYSTNVGVATFFGFLACCNKDNCNDINIPDPDNTPNGLKCYTCNSMLDTVCNTTVSCVGNQNRCVNNTNLDLPIFGTVVNPLIPVISPLVPVASPPEKGCISKSFCDSTQVTNINCCTGYLCNGSKDLLRLDLSLLLMALTATMLQL
ncbi:hypothetical protein NFI96_031835, partial [Prochilodus magdalenae]